jgi:hypothetical protein
MTGGDDSNEFDTKNLKIKTFGFAYLFHVADCDMRQARIASRAELSHTEFWI